MMQAFAAVATVLSLVLVGFQIRQNTRTTRAASHQNVSNSLNEINRMFAESGDVGIHLAEDGGIRTVMSSPGSREWWDQNPYGFGEEFRRYVAQLLPAEDSAA